VAAVGAGRTTHAERDLGQVALLPGLVNAHTHLELSYLRDQVPPAPEFVDWIRAVMAARRERPDPRSPEILRSVRDAVNEAIRCGTALVGDISNTLVSTDALVSSPLGAVVFFEVIRFNAPDPARVVADAVAQIDAMPPSRTIRGSLAAHAPYSVSSNVFRAIRSEMDRRGAAPCSVHLAEGREEIEFINTGEGAWRRVLETVGSWDPAWTAPGVSPVRHLDDLRFLDRNVLAVHGVQMTGDDLAILASRGATLVTCPRSTRTQALELRQSTGSTSRAWRWQSAPTAWRVRRI
jgi:cytosine/adenosine deaminase-related metal-dependent hydrolase